MVLGLGPTASSVLIGGAGGLVVVATILLADRGEIRRRAGAIGVTGAILILGLHIAAVRTVMNRTTLAERWGLWLVAVFLGFALGFMFLTNDGVPWFVNLLAQDNAVLAGFAAVLWFGPMGWAPFGLGVEILGWVIGPAQAVAVLIFALALLDERGVIEGDLWAEA